MIAGRSLHGLRGGERPRTPNVQRGHSLTPGYGSVDFRSVLRAVNRIGYSGYCTIASAPMVPDADTAARDGIACLKLLARVVEYQLSPECPNGFAVGL